MINLYLYKPDDVVMCNDEFFTSVTYMKVKNGNDNVLKSIEDLEGSKIKGNMLISKFTGEELHLNCLSTGCKTLLNIILNKDKIFFAGEVGLDVLERIFSLKSANIYLSNMYLPIYNIKNNILVHTINEIVNFNDTDSLSDWWCNYES